MLSYVEMMIQNERPMNKSMNEMYTFQTEHLKKYQTF